MSPWRMELPEEVDLLAVRTAFGESGTDHETGRMIQVIEDMGELDNTLMINLK